MDKEIWKDIKDYEGLYQVSNYGKVKRLKRIVSNHTGYIELPEKILKERISKKGYVKYALYKNGKQKNCFAHRLCMIAFVENTNNYPQINHINGNKRDNYIGNLEYCTNKQNQIHAWKNGLQKPKYSKNNPNARSVDVYDLNNKYIKSYDSMADAIRELKLRTSSHIVQCCKKQRNKAYGYIWRYKGEKLC